MIVRLIRKEAKELINSRGILFLLGAVSIILIIGISYSSKNMGVTGEYKISIGVENRDNSFYSRLLLNYFQEDENFANYASLIPGTEKELSKDFYAGTIDAYLVIPENFAKNLIEVTNIPIEVKISTQDTTTAVILKNILEGYEKYITAVEINAVALYEIMEREKMPLELIEQVNVDISTQLVFTALGRDGIFDYQEIKSQKATPLSAYYTYVLTAMVLLYSGIYGGLRFLKERKAQVWSRGVVAGISMTQQLLAKFLFYGVLSFLAVSAVLGLLQKQLGIPITGKRYLVLALMAFFSTALGLFLAFLFQEERAYAMGANMFQIITCIIGGAVVPVMYLPEGVLLLARLTPVYWFVRLMTA